MTVTATVVTTGPVSLAFFGGQPTDLRPDGRLWVNLDLAQQGIGSASCGPGVLPAYRLDPAPASLTVRLYPGPADPSRR